jgi:hypothetical protein
MRELAFFAEFTIARVEKGVTNEGLVTKIAFFITKCTATLPPSIASLRKLKYLVQLPLPHVNVRVHPHEY